ncbi:hypothetical protein BOX15_Mlig000471g3 [Macrostomum lignano]|uniref:C2 domain-containing protein n=1 Tax=Macrostomum lignano TaxID=282301 RepID=A0A267G8Q2_9PLAT|nr:hypothetical protein BOX15_Mlig000471g3 [Macrostomum lignano]
MSKLIVTVDSASNLPNVDTFGASDPYCIVEIKGLKSKTKVIDNDLNPVWKEKFEFDVGPPLTAEDKVIITVKDYEKIGSDKLLGMCEISLKDLVKGGKQTIEVNAPLQDANKRAIGATIKLMIAYIGKKKDGSTANERQGTVVDVRADDGDSELDYEVDEPDGDFGDPSLEGHHDQHHRRRAGGHHRRRRNVGSAARRKTRSKLSNKPQDFQIRVKVVEARQLQGANISPVCRVTCYNQMKQTRIKKSTNSPYWGETFFFNFHVSPADLMEELVECGVFNSRRLRSDALIGAFKFDLGMLYEEDGHAFLHKWLLLCDPEDPQGGAKGYLKICAVILGPGDEAPSFKQTANADEDEDIEANLLRPAGVQLRPATFTLRVYRAEDLPRMDSEMFQGVKKIFTGTSTKELVDPYLVFQFAGKEVHTDTKYTDDHPEWNEELRIGLQFPSMCERIKLQMFDWDRLTEDDVIGTAYIDISLISAQGESGYLPTFGPAFINFYGSPREFSELGDEFCALNEGKGEGVAYRGRLLAELRTELGETPDQSKGDISEDQLTKVQKFLRRRKFRLHAAFGSATMISEVDAPVEFEISIGNYGNKLDDTVPPTASTTQPTNAVFDGVHYYFLPWGKTKPCAVVDSQWEDISFRLHAVNFLHKIIQRLDESIEKINVAMKAKLPEEEQAQFVIAALDDLILMCNKDLPEWEPGQSPVNELDLYLTSLRENQLKSIRAAATKLRAECTSVEEALNELDSFRSQIRAVAVEPQNSFPDVVIWMLCADKRIAYYRMPAYEVLYCKNDDFRGKFCGKVQNVLFKPPSVKQNEENRLEIPALVRLTVWLGHEKDESEWLRMQREGSLSVLAETYENEWYFVKWMKSGPGRPAWSDASGRVEILKDKLTPPAGWKWERDWFVSPELSLFYDKDAGHSEFLEDVYVNETRMPGGAWQDAKVKYTDVKGDPCSEFENIKPPEGWRWKDEWKVDFNRPCDEEGWEYTVEASMGGYVPTEKMFHMCRRRRYIRPRVLISATSPIDETKKMPEEITDPEQCWEYAIGFGQKFHANKRPVDLVRRRRWQRKLLPTKPGAPCFFNMTEKAGDNKALLAAPRMVLMYDKPRRWQLRAYVFQARDLLAGDQTGLSDPYARVIFHTRSGSPSGLTRPCAPPGTRLSYLTASKRSAIRRVWLTIRPRLWWRFSTTISWARTSSLAGPLCSPW